MASKKPYIIIKRLIARDKLWEAIAQLHKFARDRVDKNELLAQEARLNAIERSERLNITTPDELKREKANIRTSLLSLADQLFEVPINNGGGRQVISFLSLLIALGIIIFSLYCYFTQIPQQSMKSTISETFTQGEKRDSTGMERVRNLSETQPAQKGSSRLHQKIEKSDSNLEENKDSITQNSPIISEITLKGRVLNNNYEGVNGVLVKVDKEHFSITDETGSFKLKVDPTEFPSGALYLHYQKDSIQGTMTVWNIRFGKDIEILLYQ